MAPSRLQNEDHGPVFEDIIGRLYRSSGQGIAEVVADFPEERRARLALFCYGRAHMRDIGLAIAATCDLGALDEAGAAAGRALFMLSRERPAPLGKPVGARQRITLATAASDRAPVTDIDPEPEAEEAAGAGREDAPARELAEAV